MNKQTQKKYKEILNFLNKSYIKIDEVYDQLTDFKNKIAEYGEWIENQRDNDDTKNFFEWTKKEVLERTKKSYKQIESIIEFIIRLESEQGDH